MAEMTHPSIALFALGGTIAMTRSAGGGARPALDGAALVDAVPELAGIAELRVESVARLPSANLTFAQTLDLARRIDIAADDGADGVVVTTGTDSMADIAFILALLLQRRLPVVLTGAMRHPEMPSPDGPANLLDAVIAATHPELGACGPLVAMAGRLHAARFVEKRHTTSVAAFASPAAGPVAEIVEGRLRRLTQPEPVPHLPWSAIGPVPSVPLVPAVFGDIGGVLLETLAESTAGLVIEAMGGGHLPETMADRAADLAERIPVVLASRTGGGPVLESTYGYRGAEIDLIGRGLIPAGLYSGAQARILLALALAAGRPAAEINQLFHG